MVRNVWTEINLKPIAPMKNTNSVTAGLRNKSSIKSQLAAVGLPALLLAFSLPQSDTHRADVIVAGGPEVVKTTLVASQFCVPCTPGVFVADSSS